MLIFQQRAFNPGEILGKGRIIYIRRIIFAEDGVLIIPGNRQFYTSSYFSLITPTTWFVIITTDLY
jgi:hypothetical protein